MSESATFRINIKTGEIEITGSEEFVEARINSLDEVLELISEVTVPPEPQIPTTTQAATSSNETEAETETSPSADDIPETFGEWMHQFRDDVNDLDKGLITALFVQKQAATNDFKTSEVNKSLKDHGIKLSNPSVTLNRLVSKKLLFQTRKDGKLKYFRVSTDGQKHLDTLKREG